MKTAVIYTGLVFLCCFQISCGDVKVSSTPVAGAGSTDENLDVIDNSFAKGSSGYYEAEGGDTESLKLSPDGLFSKVELYKAGFGEKAECKFSLQGVISVFTRHESNRKKFWSEATHLLKMKVGTVVLLNTGLLNPIEQRTCEDFRKREFNEGFKVLKYYISFSGMNSIRFYNSAQDELSGTDQAPRGTVFRKL